MSKMGSGHTDCCSTTAFLKRIEGEESHPQRIFSSHKKKEHLQALKKFTFVGKGEQFPATASVGKPDPEDP
jgi:hypothetical protein